jgi:hypothetical protein
MRRRSCVLLISWLAASCAQAHERSAFDTGPFRSDASHLPDAFAPDTFANDAFSNDASVAPDAAVPRDAFSVDAFVPIDARECTVLGTFDTTSTTQMFQTTFTADGHWATTTGVSGTYVLSGMQITFTNQADPPRCHNTYAIMRTTCDAFTLLLVNEVCNIGSAGVRITYVRAS